MNAEEFIRHLNEAQELMKDENFKEAINILEHLK